ncbi:hypothetical protein LAZ67_20001353 [Cordylochernes scorpioides]|uniref:Uncharacterized protein n=1 Tax=Cordylochernes scorpioides TaxID=51811 RepID=A0ABY6LNR8_9ARAC|nr:hypothetical protein LAZ67_20001353 [Cordylochernes scorpioides]
MVEMFNSDPHWLKNAITGDETWVHRYDPEIKRQSSQWLEPRESRFKKVRILKSKCLITFFDVKGLLVYYEFVSEGQTINKHYCLEVKDARNLAILRTRQHRDSWKERHDSKHLAISFEVCDLVLRRIPFNDPRLIKTSPKYEGPLNIVKKFSNVT